MAEDHAAAAPDELLSLFREALRLSSPGGPRRAYLARAGLLTAGELRVADLALTLAEELLRDVRKQPGALRRLV
jgi:hypothetical protein